MTSDKEEKEAFKQLFAILLFLVTRYSSLVTVVPNFMKFYFFQLLAIRNTPKMINIEGQKKWRT